MTSDVIYEYQSLDPYQKFIIEEFNKSLFDNIFNKNLDLLTKIGNYDMFKFNNDTWNRNPMKFTLDKYGFIYFERIILLVNNIPNYFEFTSQNLKEILGPKASILKELIHNNIY